MEAFSHSRSHFRPQSTTFSNNNTKPPLFSSNNNNNGGFFAATSYDDVFGGPPKYAALAPRPEDYSEIFNAFRPSSSSRASSSSIPFLDLPSIDNIDSAFDYSDVFAGLDAVAFAVSFDELFRPFDVGDPDADGGSSDEAWTPVGTESLSEDSDPFALSEKSQCYSNDNSHQPLDNKQFNVSYHKVNLESNMCMPNMTHVAQLNAVPGYTCVVDDTSSLRERAERLNRAETDDVPSMDSSIMPEKYKNKTVAEMSTNDGTRGRAHAANMSHVNSASSSVSNLNLMTESSHLPPSSRLPPVAAERKGEISRTGSSLKASDDCALEVTADNKFPPCFDMEVDESSFAAASAAAMKDAMDKAQARLRAVKVLIDRKKGGLQDAGHLGLMTDVNAEKNVHTSLSDMKIFHNDECATVVSQSLPDFSAVLQSNFVTQKSVDGKYRKKCSLSMNTAFNEEDGGWKEASQYYEFVTNDNSRVAPQPPSNVDSNIGSSRQQNDDEHSSDSAGEVCVPERNRPRLKTVKSVSRKEYYEKMFKVAQEVHESMIGGYINPNHRFTVPQDNHRVQKGKLGFESANDAIETGKIQRAGEKNSGDAFSNEEAVKSHDAFGFKEIKNKEMKKKVSEVFHQEQSHGTTCGPHQRRAKEFPEKKGEKRRVKDVHERVGCDQTVQEMVAEEKKAEEVYEKSRMENKLADTVKQKKEKKKEVKEKEPFEDGLREKDGQTACGTQETGNAKDFKRKVEDKNSKEALTNSSGEEKLKGTSEFQKYDKKLDFCCRDEDRNFFEVAVNGEGSGRILEECVDLGICWKVEEASEELIRRQAHRKEFQKFAAGDMKRGDDSNREYNGNHVKELTEFGKIDNNSVLVDEMDEPFKIPEKTGDVEIQNISSEKCIIIEWDDEDLEPERSPVMELPVENGYLKSSERTDLSDDNAKVEPNTRSKVRSPRKEAEDSQHVTVQKEDVEVSALSYRKANNLKTADPAAVLVNEKTTNSAAAEMAFFAPKDGRIVHAACSFYRNSDNNIPGEIRSEIDRGFQPVLDPVLVEDSNLEQAGRRNLGDGHNLSDEKGKNEFTLSEGISGWNNHEHAKNKEVDIEAIPKLKESILRKSHLPNISQGTEEKGTISEQCTLEEKVTEKEENLKQEQLRKLEEERERQREREKDRMAVEIAIREARERAYAHVRDQAEKATLERAAEEARQRMMTEARERLEKACAEARERPIADKASNVWLKADRVAVERAAAEARQRAIEKAMAERETIEVRERMQRSLSENYMCEKDVTRQSSMPTMHSEEFEVGDDEPVQRSKARLERHRRTVERVANALAEKNMRDLLTQREQAERSRLAETLDADIKRWSNGKERNLRALLSTLQYILGPDSGWQPIPLTEVITAAAVKKAYRKATLCVHPDKLQQRGASIQQKYICEKVFDLLKEAWNRFNSEEK